MGASVIIRDEISADVAVIAKLITTAFAPMPYSSQTEAQIVARLREAASLTLSLVAVEDGDLVGHIAFSPVTVGGRDMGWFGLGPVAVRPDRQGRGLGDALVRAGLARLTARGAGGCVLLGDPKYYDRFGFAVIPGLTYNGAPARYFQALSLCGETPGGEVAYHAAFG